MRRCIRAPGAQIRGFDQSQLRADDLMGEMNRSQAHLLEKGYLTQIVESLVDLCITLVDIISLAFPTEESLKNFQGNARALERVWLAYQSLHYWHARVMLQLPIGTDRNTVQESVMLSVDLLQVYY